jgi:hypothetical protein
VPMTNQKKKRGPPPKTGARDARSRLRACDRRCAATLAGLFVNGPYARSE